MTIIVRSAAGFVTAVVLSLAAGLALVEVLSADMSDAAKITAVLLALGLPVPAGILAGHYAQRRSLDTPRRRSGIGRSEFVWTFAITVGAIVFTSFGGWVAGFFYGGYFLGLAILHAIARVRAGNPPFSLRMSGIYAIAVIVSAVVVGVFFGPLIDIAMRVTR